MEEKQRDCLKVQLDKVAETLADPRSLGFASAEGVTPRPLPSTRELHRMMDIIRAVIFPGYFGDTALQRAPMAERMRQMVEELHDLLTEQILASLYLDMRSPEEDHEVMAEAECRTLQFLDRLPEVRATLLSDVQATFDGDPAATRRKEIIFCYPGIRAIMSYRVAHELYKLNVPFLSRFISEMAHSETGIDIHPGAQIGASFSIDHGTGVVIGQTSIIGRNVKLYQGVTLGATSPLERKEDGSMKRRDDGKKRHPTVEDDVIIYSNAVILGDITVGRGAIIGGSEWIKSDVPAGETPSRRKLRMWEGSGI